MRKSHTRGYCILIDVIVGRAIIGIVSVKVITQHSKTRLYLFFQQFLMIMDASMKPSFSYWSKRRRVHNNVAENFATVLSSPEWACGGWRN